MDNAVLNTAKRVILQAAKSLPIIMISFIGFLALALGNLSLFILFLGHSILLPVAVYISQFLFDKISTTPESKALYFRESGQATSLIELPDNGEPVNVAPSFWLAHVLFFLGYILANAVSIMMIPDDPKLNSNLTKNRKFRAGVIIGTTIMFSLIVALLRYRTNSETLRGIVIAFVGGGFLGYGWYQFADICGARAADIFGVALQMMPASATDEKPMTCVYAPKP
jgi:hypothetical protein